MAALKLRKTKIYVSTTCKVELLLFLMKVRLFRNVFKSIFNWLHLFLSISDYVYQEFKTKTVTIVDNLSLLQ